MKTAVCRRRFLAGAAAAGAGLVILRRSESAWSYQANEKLNVALVGVGGRGTWFVETIPRMENVVAVCDVNAKKIDEAFSQWETGARKMAASEQSWERKSAETYKRLTEAKPKTFADFRKMLDAMSGGIDAVVVATPDHSHAVASAAAMHAGKHVFCEKPLTRTIHESRALRDLARKQKVATSMGNQGTASPQFRRALELIRNGAIGEIQEVHVWNTGGGSDQKQPPREEEPVPDGFDWDLWLGPAKMRPYSRKWTQRHNWREFGTCQLGNWGSHTANLAFMALKVHELWLAEQKAAPRICVTAKTSGINRLSFPRWEHIVWEIPARAEFPPIKINWYNGAAPGTREIVVPLLKGLSDREEGLYQFAGALLVGTKGRIHSTGHNATFRIFPEEQFAGLEKNRPEKVDASRGHEQDWFIACRGGKPAWANFDYASALNEFLMLGNVATQFEETLEYEPVAMKIPNNAEADAQLRSEYRAPWSL